MKKRIVFAVFALMLLGISLSGCRSKELCPAYTDADSVELRQEETA
jgi:hypothetical protein